MQVEQRLLPCPFCGSTDIYIEPDEVGSGGQWVGPLHIGCNVQTGCGASIAPDDERESLIAAWNTRFEASLPPSAPVVPDDVRELVIAARVFWDELSGPFPESDDLDKALEPFASRVPYANQPEVSHEA